MTSLKTSIKTITYLSDIGCLEIQGASLGARNNMYLDTANNVTVGIGRMLPNSQAGYNLGFTKTHHIPRGHGDSEDVEISASHGDIDSAFNATKEKRASNVHLSDQSMVADCVNQLDKDRTTLRNMYTDFDHFPQPAKTALHDMLYNLGEGKLHSEFPNFNAAVNRKDWTRAATESHRTGIGDSRNKDTHDQFIAAGNK
jgi:GH24 family phage-related lysozyme (muramidase)